MANPNESQGIKITLEELGVVSVPAHDSATGTSATPTGEKTYGNISSAADPTHVVDSETKGSLLLRAWFYLGIAGGIGALIAWAICEPAFVDLAAERWGNIWLLPLMVAMLCIGFGVAESVVERSIKKGAYRTALAIPLGVIFGFVFNFAANIVFTIGLGIGSGLGMHDDRSPLFWIARAVAWACFGIAGGMLYGIIGHSMKKAQYGILGGVLGAFIGGVLFDPIAIGLKTASVSRAVGLVILGAATGVAMGVVESALKHKWLYVSTGPLAGKQFILYKPHTTIGSNQQSDIYLFKDPNILPEHAFIEQRGNYAQLTARGPVFVQAQPVRTSRVLQDGELIQIGRYGFRYREKQKS
jgi:hypothetical protein